MPQCELTWRLNIIHVHLGACLVSMASLPVSFMHCNLCKRKWLSTSYAQYMGISVLSLLGFIWHKSFQVNVFEHSSPAVGIVLGTFLSWGRCGILGMCLENSGLALLQDFSGFRLDTTYHTTGFQHHRPSFPDSWPIRLSYLKRRFLWMMRKNKYFLPWAVIWHVFCLRDIKRNEYKALNSNMSFWIVWNYQHKQCLLLVYLPAKYTCICVHLSTQLFTIA